MVRQEKSDARKERHSGDPKSSVRAPAKKDGGGGKYTMGKVTDQSGGTFLDTGDPNFDPDEKRVDPEDGVAYKFSELATFYKGKYNKQTIAEYWEYECTPVKSKWSSKQSEAKAKDPSLADSAALVAKSKAKSQAASKEGKRLSEADMGSDGPLAKEIASKIPYYPYKKLDKFYDIQGLLKFPQLLNAMCAVMAKRYRKMGITKIAGVEARGFLFSFVSIKMGVPFVMLRKEGKMPNTISSAPYTKEYEGVDAICVQKGMFEPEDKVAIIDDLIATGGTLCAAIELVKACKAEVTECACMVELKALKGREKCMKAGAKGVWGFISEELLTTKAELPSDYVDDGKP